MSDFLPSNAVTRHASWLYSQMRFSPPASLTNLRKNRKRIAALKAAWVRRKAKFGGTGFKRPALLDDPL
tara:strand:- start:2142 stop:2348 length:207 start_codon:yes stop_codon:yes gene_type:complete